LKGKKTRGKEKESLKTQKKSKRVEALKERGMQAWRANPEEKG